MIVWGGKQIHVPGVRTVCWLEHPELRLQLPEDGRRRPEGADIRSVVMHSTKGWPDGSHKHVVQRVIPGCGASAGGIATFRFWSHSSAQAGAHFVGDRDGTIYQGADPITEIAYHAGDRAVNEHSIGFEIWQGSDGSFWEGQLDSVADFVVWLTCVLDLPRQIHWPYGELGDPGTFRPGRPTPGIAGMHGVYGHRDVTADRDFGDPGDVPLLHIARRGGFRLAPLDA